MCYNKIAFFWPITVNTVNKTVKKNKLKKVRNLLKINTGDYYIQTNTLSML